jgi:hypothetical protein
MLHTLNLESFSKIKEDKIINTSINSTKSEIEGEKQCSFRFTPNVSQNNTPKSKFGMTPRSTRQNFSISVPSG